jgi:GDP-L-fucose synthase
MNKDSKIYIAGHKGLVGSAILRHLQDNGYLNLVYKTHDELDLTDQAKVHNFFKTEKPQFVYLVAARVGGIYANNTYPADFLYENLAIETNILHAAHQHGVKKLLFTGSNCVYPKFAPQPIKEDSLLTGPLEPTNEPYAVAKIAGIIMCKSYHRQFGDNFFSVMPVNLYGINDNFNLENGHLLPSLIRKAHEAKINNAAYMQVWGTGTVKREVMYVDDLADCCTFLMHNYEGEDLINIGSGQEYTIREIAEIIKNVVGFRGEIKFNPDYPDGTPRKILDSSKVKELGWNAITPFELGIKRVYEWFVSSNFKRI